jgi:hypothetical protein
MIVEAHLDAEENMKACKAIKVTVSATDIT